MKKAHRIFYIILSIILSLSLTTASYANSLTADTAQSNSQTERVSWNDLPYAYQEIIDQDAIIYRNTDGTFDIYQENPISQETRALERYAPNGGTYSHFSNPSYGGSKDIFLIYRTYMPADAVGQYLIQNETSTLDSAIQWVAAYGITTALTMLANAYGLHISSNALNLAISTAIVYFSSYNYSQMLNASGGGQHGVQIDYITIIGSGNSRVYSKWGSEPYVLSLPNGGSASWAEGEYYAEP